MSDVDSLHVVVFPWLSFGHMLPFLELSKSLAQRGHRVTYISTPRNIQRLSQIQPGLSTRIQLLSFPLPPVEHLPETAEATGDLPPEKIQYLKKAFDGLEAPFSAFLRSTRAGWIVMDFAQHWLLKTVHECRVPCTFFSVFMSPTLVFMGPSSEVLDGYRSSVEDFTVPPRWVPFPSKVTFRFHEAHLLLGFRDKNASGVTDAERIASAINGSKFVSVRSCHDLESKWLSLLSEIYEKDVVPVGLLPPDYIDGSLSETRSTNAGELDVMDWLDQQAAESVLYIAFGSKATLSLELLHELALGIEMSKVSFLWALRKPMNISDDEQILPEGFEERTKEFGVVTTGWVPQMRVLAHASTGGFLTHCGWSSVIENFQFGHPLVQLPIFADQGLTDRILEEKGVGVAIPRDERTGYFNREDVAKVVRLIMVDEDGKAVRRNAKRLKEVFADRSAHERHVDEFVEKLKKFKQDV